MPMGMPRFAPFLLACSLVLACAADPDPGEPGGDDDDDAVFDPAPVVIVVLVDTLADGYLGHRHPSWDVTPHVDDLLAESTVLENTLTVRGLTSVAVSSILTGVYPRHHFVRNNANRKRPAQPLLIERFHDAGYTTYGYASNVCQFIDEGVDDRYCTWTVETPDPSVELRERDEMLVDRLLEQLAEQPAGEPTFVWLHLMHPHKPYIRVDPWYAEFHPEPYGGLLDHELDEELDQVALGETTLDAEDLAHVEAVYASQVKETDRLLGELFEGLDNLGLWDDAVVVFGADHGEELGAHHDYFWHSCSPYLPVNRVLFSIRAPGRLPTGPVLPGWTSVVDIAPTVIHTAGLGWSGQLDGVSHVDGILDGALTERPVFLERGDEAAGVVTDGYLYVRDENLGYGACSPYNGSDLAFPAGLDELYDIATDPAQHDDLAELDPGAVERMRGILCDWVAAEPWHENANANDRNDLVQSCRQVVAEAGADDGGDGSDTDGSTGCSAGGETAYRRLRLPAAGALGLLLVWVARSRCKRDKRHLSA